MVLSTEQGLEGPYPATLRSEFSRGTAFEWEGRGSRGATGPDVLRACPSLSPQETGRATPSSVKSPCAAQIWALGQVGSPYVLR